MDRLHTIPNGLNVALAAGYYAYAFLAGIPAPEIFEHTWVAFAMLILLAFAASQNIFGGGAAKLVAVAFLWFGFWPGVGFVTISMLACGCAGCLVQAMRGEEAPMPYLPFAAVTAALMLAVPHIGQFFAS